MTLSHVPVLVEAVSRYLVYPGTRVIADGTVGSGGHTEALLEAHRGIEVVGIDRDPGALEIAAKRLRRFGKRVRLVESCFSNLPRALAGVGKVDGVLLDLGVSSMQLDTPDRGFSYRGDGPLDMRMSGDGPSAQTLIDQLDAGSLSRLMREYGEVRRPKRIARSVVRAREAGAMKTTTDLRRAVVRALGGRENAGELSRVFQALRIAVNRELDELDAALRDVVSFLNPRGRLVVIGYHSLEDRRVKNFIRRESSDCVCPPGIPACVCGHTATLHTLTRRTVRPDEAEMAANPRARSARLRAAEVLH